MIPFSVLMIARIVACFLFILIVGVPFLLPLLSKVPMFNKGLLGSGLLDWTLTLSPYIIVVAGLMHLPAFRLDKDELLDAIRQKKWSLLFNSPNRFGTRLHFRDAIHLNTKRSAMGSEKDCHLRWVSVFTRGKNDPKVSVCLTRIVMAFCFLVITVVGFLLPLVPDLVHRHYEVQPAWSTGLGVFVEGRLVIYMIAVGAMVPALMVVLRKVRSIRFNSRDNTVSVETCRFFGLFGKEREVVGAMTDLHGIQIIDYRGKTLNKNQRYTQQYELNLVFKNASRLHLHKLSVASPIRRDAIKLGSALNLPIWDHSVVRYVVDPEPRSSVHLDGTPA